MGPRPMPPARSQRPGHPPGIGLAHLEGGSEINQIWGTTQGLLINRPSIGLTGRRLRTRQWRPVLALFPLQAPRPGHPPPPSPPQPGQAISVC